MLGQEAVMPFQTQMPRRLLKMSRAICRLASTSARNGTATIVMQPLNREYENDSFGSVKPLLFFIRFRYMSCVSLVGLCRTRS